MRRSQLLMVTYILENRRKHSFETGYIRLFKDLERFRIPEENIHNPLNYMMLESIHKR
jgi:hypothetical protein